MRRGIYLVGADCYVGVRTATGLTDVTATSLAYRMTCVNNMVMIMYDVRGRLALARVGNCFNRKYRLGWRPCINLCATVDIWLIIDFLASW